MKKVWITGGGSGIGKALAQKLSNQGNKVFISGRNEGKLKDVGNKTVPIACDILEEGQIDDAVKQIGEIDLAILNAGSYDPGPSRTPP